MRNWWRTINFSIVPGSCAYSWHMNGCIFYRKRLQTSPKMIEKMTIADCTCVVHMFPTLTTSLHTHPGVEYSPQNVHILPFSGAYITGMWMVYFLSNQENWWFFISFASFKAILGNSEGSDIGLHAQGNVQERGGKPVKKKIHGNDFSFWYFLVVMGNTKKRFHRYLFFAQPSNHALVNHLVRVDYCLSLQNHPVSP